MQLYGSTGDTATGGGDPISEQPAASGTHRAARREQAGTAGREQVRERSAREQAAEQRPGDQSTAQAARRPSDSQGRPLQAMTDTETKDIVNACSKQFILDATRGTPARAADDPGRFLHLLDIKRTQRTGAGQKKNFPNTAGGGRGCLNS